ncbi:HNH endonuclease [Spiroplasma gladiatoris]|uniref:HNH endonuclease n=1 Tax=Spiroplasma gladiatoris TaxID=2143 RepID=A0A4P7AHF4_9MOLU|nr:HNH endonuclease [Spiroplasma gladiatoris]QBQ07612.1 HNH endonuclease [Spiroplasma gladiatoris]
MNKIIWQAPGNGKIFDSSFYDINKTNSYMTTRSFYVLEFFIKMGKIKIIKIKDLEKQIKNYLINNFKSFKKNDSVVSHFYKPLIFYGLLKYIYIGNDKYIMPSFEGRKFVSEIKINNSTLALSYFFRATMEVMYPNDATPDVKNLYLFPFRIIYYYILKNGFITKDFIDYKIVFINTIADINNNIFYNLKNTSKNKKFRTWVINSLVDVGILNLKNDIYTLNNNIITLIQNEYEMNIDKMFFTWNDEIEFYDTKIITKNKARNQKLAKSCIERSNFKCEIDNNHFTFNSLSNNMYLESHHVIPFSMQNRVDFELDVIDNLIALCPNCHKAMHYGDSNIKTSMINAIYNYKNNFLYKNNINLNDLLYIYLNNTYLYKN